MAFSTIEKECLLFLILSSCRPQFFPLYRLIFRNKLWTQFHKLELFKYFQCWAVNLNSRLVAINLMEMYSLSLQFNGKHSRMAIEKMGEPLQSRSERRLSGLKLRNLSNSTAFTFELVVFSNKTFWTRVLTHLSSDRGCHFRSPKKFVTKHFKHEMWSFS